MSTEQDHAILDYEKQELTLYWKGDFHSFDLTKGDVGDFWSSIVSKDDEVFEINFHQEDEEQPPTVDIYAVELDELGYVRVTDNIDSIDADRVFTRGNQSKYFNRVLDNDWDIEVDEVTEVFKLRLFGQEYKVTTLWCDKEVGREITKIERWSSKNYIPDHIDDTLRDIIYEKINDPLTHFLRK